MTDGVRTLNCVFSSETALYLSYMPYIKSGGLFIRTMDAYELGDSVQLSIQLLSDADPYLIEGKVVWVTPRGAQGNKLAGIGVQFLGEDSRILCNKIETYLAGMLKSTHMTDTI